MVSDCLAFTWMCLCNYCCAYAFVLICILGPSFHSVPFFVLLPACYACLVLHHSILGRGDTGTPLSSYSLSLIYVYSLSPYFVFTLHPVHPHLLGLSHLGAAPVSRGHTPPLSLHSAFPGACSVNIQSLYIDPLDPCMLWSTH